MVIIFVVEAFTYDKFENLGFGFIRIGSGLIRVDLGMIIPGWSRDDLGMLWPESILDEIWIFPDNLGFLSLSHSYENHYLHELLHLKVLTKMSNLNSNWNI